MNYTKQNENSLDSLACVTMFDYDSTLIIIYSKSKSGVINDLSTFCISVMMNSDEFCWNVLNCKIQYFHYWVWAQELMRK